MRPNGLDAQPPPPPRDNLPYGTPWAYDVLYHKRVSLLVSFYTSGHVFALRTNIFTRAPFKRRKDS